MGLHLRVAPQLEALAQAMASVLSDPLKDPFETEVLAVPGDGVRSWLMDHLSSRLGTDPFDNGAGIAANIEVVFPATVVRRALLADPSYQQVMSAWSVGALTWAIYDLMHTDGERLGITGDLQRARILADQLDRYGMHRVEMVRAWEAGRDVDAIGRPLPHSVAWQPRLWRALREHLGPFSGPAAMADATNQLRLGRIRPELPPRVFLFGLASIPVPHMRVLLALSTQIDVEMFVPTWSLQVWRGVKEISASRPLLWPIERSLDPSASVNGHRFGSQWGRIAREAQLMLAAAVLAEPDALITEIDPQPLQSQGDESVVSSRVPPSLLAQIQADIRADTEPPGAIAQPSSSLARGVFDPFDRSLSWHRCHGPARQAEVLRDVVRGLLEERDAQGRPLFDPREIAVLCADPAVSAPLISAAFATDAAGHDGAIPMRVADRSLREDSSLFATVSALLDLLEGRFRSSDLLAFAALEPIRTRYGWDIGELGRIATWVEETGTRWGLDGSQQTAFGLPADLKVHTWRAGLDQLLLGAVMGDRLLRSEGGTAHLAALAHPGIEGDLVGLVGKLADLVEDLQHFSSAFSQVTTPAEWCWELSNSVQKMCQLPEDQAWQWQRFDSQITGLLEEAEVGGRSQSAPVSAHDMAEFFRARLVGSAGRVRFGTGSVTVSSLTAQRGVPHRVIVIHGLDDDLGAGTGRADDLIAAQPCLGDRDQRSELRAQLLDAVMAASERLIIINTGRDITSNEEVPPAVPLAELADLIDATAMPANPRDAAVSMQITVQHPRHGWGPLNFQAGKMLPGVPWGFQPSDLEAAVMRQSRGNKPTADELWAELSAEHPLLRSPVISIESLERTLRNPLRTYLSDRLGVTLLESSEEVEDLIPLSVAGLDRWRLRKALLDERLRVGSRWGVEEVESWTQTQRVRGQVPPFIFGSAAVADAAQVIDGLLETAFGDRMSDLDQPASQHEVEVDLGRVQIHGVIGGIRGSQILSIHPGTLRADHILSGWIRLLALACAVPEVAWKMKLVGLGPNKKPTSMVMSTEDKDTAFEAISAVVALHQIAAQIPVVALARTAMALALEGVGAARSAWEGHRGAPGERDDLWVRFAYGNLDFGDLFDRPPTRFEQGPDWSQGNSQLERWSHRIWSLAGQFLPVTRTKGGADE